MKFQLMAGALLAVLLAGCGNSMPGATSKDSGGGASDSTGSTTNPVKADRDGTIYRQAIDVTATGDNQVFQVFEPTHLKVGQTYPLVLQGHGYGGSRETAAPDGSFIKKLMDAGYYVISIDERGFGESSGQVRVMDPEFEGADLTAILDWAENLEGLRRGGDGQMVVGSYGGSYGGMYQFALMGSDPKHRLHVLAPDITPHDLTYALDENNVVKSGWGLVLIAGGEAGAFEGDPSSALQQLLTRIQAGEVTRQDPILYEILLDASLNNAFTDGGKAFFEYHSVNYFCAGQPAAAQGGFVVGTPDQLLVAPTAFPRADVLLTQGFRDTLFNFNNAYDNYQCLKQLGGDVRLYTHQTGHILPVSASTVPLPPGSNLETALDPFYTAINLPAFQDAGGSRSCGKLVLDDLQFAWFQEKLQHIAGAVDAATNSGRDICLSVAEGDSIQVPSVKIGGTPFRLDASTPQFNSVLSVGGAALGNGAREALLATQPIYTAAADTVVAGIPTLSVDIEGLTGAEMTGCATPLVQAACDPIFYIGLGHQHAGSNLWDLVDDQITPVRGFGQHDLQMNGIAERIPAGDQLAVLIYGFHLQYPVTWSRDLLVPAATISGTISLPVLDKSEIVRDGG
ncbi:MAG TPA: CocE/NonD family hydrolase [Nevskiaceae bacterium]|nr:CocE/NonD family hydrolase [Nevskiaceae bacterium]